MAENTKILQPQQALDIAVEARIEALEKKMSENTASIQTEQAPDLAQASILAVEARFEALMAAEARFEALENKMAEN
ncbi:MAG TPA: hypothetical protein DIT99_00400, partial [Candidatus Latescibacteria bacterium]|nr:hypothetical protein [Candidatus Latescibacterota bacterium]